MNVPLREHLRETILEMAKPLHKNLRGQKIELFLDFVGGASLGGRLLDVGGGPGIDGEFLEMYANFGEVVVANRQEQRLEVPNGLRVQLIEADGRDLPFKSRSFDWVFSNAVILPLYFTSSSIFPLDPSLTSAQTKVVYPEWLVMLVEINPLTYAVDSLRGAFIHFHQFDPKLGPIVLVVMGAVFFLIALRDFSKA